jgi:hypothetical protein
LPDKQPWQDYTSIKVVIEYGITSIGKRAFYGCTKITSIALPEGVTSIGEYAVPNCESLKNIVIKWDEHIHKYIHKNASARCNIACPRLCCRRLPERQSLGNLIS